MSEHKISPILQLIINELFPFVFVEANVTMPDIPMF